MTLVACHASYLQKNIFTKSIMVCPNGGGPVGTAVPADSPDCSTVSKLGAHGNVTPSADVLYCDAVPQRRFYRRSCHGTLPEQQQSLRDSWDNAVAFRKSLRDSWDLKRLRDAAADAAGSAKNADACGSHQQDQQQEVQAELDQSKTEDAPSAAHEACDAAVHVTLQLSERPSSPFAAPDVQACTCYKGAGRLSCAVHSCMAKISTERGTAPKSPALVSAAITTGEPATAAGAPAKAQKIKTSARKAVKAFLERLSFCTFNPASVPGTAGVQIHQH